MSHVSGFLIALIVATVSMPGATLTFDGSFTFYNGAAGPDPFSVLPNGPARISIVTSGDNIVNGTLMFSNGILPLEFTGGTLSRGVGQTGFDDMLDPVGPFGLAVQVFLSFASEIPDTTQAGLDTLIGQPGTFNLLLSHSSLGQFGVYGGSGVGVAADAVPEPATFGLAILALGGLLASGRRNRKGR